MHISLSGQLGSGKSTICNYLKENHNFEIFSTGAIHRKIAKEQGLSTLEFNHKLKGNMDIDAMIDKALVDYASENMDKNIIFDSRMAWHFLPNSFKVFLLVSPKVAAERVFHNRQLDEENYKTKEAALTELIERRNVETERFKNFYNADCDNYQSYDLIVDTTELTVAQIVDIVLKAYDSFNRKQEYDKYHICPSNVFDFEETKTDGEIEFKHIGNQLFTISGANKIHEAKAKKEKLVKAKRII